MFYKLLRERVWKKKSIHLRHVHLMFENDDVFPCEEPHCVGVYEIACLHKTSQEVLRTCGSTLPWRIRSQKARASATNFQVPIYICFQVPNTLPLFSFLSASHPGAILAPWTMGPSHSPFWHVVVVVVVGLPYPVHPPLIYIDSLFP